MFLLSGEKRGWMNTGKGEERTHSIRKSNCQREEGEEEGGAEQEEEEREGGEEGEGRRQLWQQKEKGKTVGAFLIYAAVGIIGYFLTVGLTLLGTRFIGEEGIWYLLMTAVVKGIVLVWNYLGRKIFVYRGK